MTAPDHLHPRAPRPTLGITPTLALTLREIRRFIRQPSRIVGTVGTPLLFWIFAASGLARSFVMPDSADQQPLAYAAFLLPGMVTMTLLFSTIFASISLIQDRKQGFLQAVIVSATPTWCIVASKVLGGSLIATAQAAFLIFAAPLLGYAPGPLGFMAAIAAAALTSVSLISIGLAAAWWINSSSGFHGVMNLLLMPMWLLSGALFPAAGAAPWLASIMNLNPLAWTTTTIAASLASQPESVPIAWLVSICFAISAFLTAAIVMARRSTTAGSGGSE